MRTRTPRLPSHAGLAPHPSSEAHMLSHKHKHKLSRPKFERLRDVEPDCGIPADAMGYFAFVAEPVIARPRKVAKPHEQYEPSKNYGADINTLIELLEAGKL